MSLWGNDQDLLWTQEEQAYWLAFDNMSGAGLGVARIKQLYERLHTLKAAWHAPYDELMSLKLFNHDAVNAFVLKRKTIDPPALLGQLERTGVKALPFYHPLYPYRLREIADP